MPIRQGQPRGAYFLVRAGMSNTWSYAAAPVFAFMALLLAAIGLYAVIAHSIGQRTREIGVQMAVGATPGKIRGMILRDGLTPMAAGMLPRRG